MPNMTEDHHKPPLPKVLTVAQFHQNFGTEEACLAKLRELRWGANLERFACPACGHPQGWWLPTRQLVECRDCHHQTSVTAGTVFHALKTPLWKWFWATYQLAQDKKGIAALELAKQIGVSYTTAWLMLHKLRRAMRHRNQRYVLTGLVEVDDCYVGGDAEGTGTTGRGAANKTPVAVAIELDDAGKPRRVALDALAKVDGHSLRKFAAKSIEKGATLRTDGWGAYRAVAKVGYRHKATVTGRGLMAVAKFPWVHTFIGNMKRMILGTHHHVSPKHLAGYLAEFAYRANRRWMEARLFDRLLVAAVSSKAVTYRQLITGAT
jgi:transposase-like protein